MQAATVSPGSAPNLHNPHFRRSQVRPSGTGNCYDWLQLYHDTSWAASEYALGMGQHIGPWHVPRGEQEGTPLLRVHGWRHANFGHVWISGQRLDETSSVALQDGQRQMVTRRGCKMRQHHASCSR